MKGSQGIVYCHGHSESFAPIGRQNRLTGWLQSGAKRSDSATQEDTAEFQADAAAGQTNGNRSSKIQAQPDAADSLGKTAGRGARHEAPTGQKHSSKVCF